MTQTSTPSYSRSDSPDLDPDDPTELDTDLADLTLNDGDDDGDGPDLPSPAKRATPAADGAGLATEDERELERFRSQWRRDLQSKQKDGGEERAQVQGQLQGKGKGRWVELSKAGAGGEQNIPRESGSVKPSHPSGPGAGETTLAAITVVRSPKKAVKQVSIDLDEDFTPESSMATSISGSAAKKLAFPPTHPVTGDRKEQAVALYARAVEHEQAGKLNEALMMYRKAFKLEDDVDRLYARSVNNATQAAVAAAAAQIDDTPSSTDIVSSAAPAEEPYSFQRHLQLQPDYEASLPLVPTHRPSAAASASASTSSRQSPLTALLSRLPVPADQTSFIPAEEHLPLPLSKLPLELLDPILGYLDIASIERFALTCWRARYVTSRAPKWKRIVEGIYRPPGVLPQGKTVKDLAVMRKYAGEWRTALMEEERVRMDGCYISVCHYIRPGAGDQWVTVTHMITYHRFLRFYPDGTVISFLTTDHPSEVVPLLRPSIRGKGLHFGYWRLIRSDSPENALGDSPLASKTTEAASASADVNENEIDGPRLSSRAKVDKDGKRRARIVITDLMEPGAESPKYEFEMELALRETGRGRWNKLDILNYQSINLATGESLGLSLKHQKPFYFSKVKSYHPHL